MAEEMANSKPACGSDAQAGEYDVALHVVGLCTWDFKTASVVNH